MTEEIQPHLKVDVRQVVFPMLAKDDSHTIVMGVSEETYDSSMTALSCASGTTSGLAPVVRTMNDAFDVRRKSS